MKMNKHMLMVLSELRKDPYFFKPDNLILYTVDNQAEVAGKTEAVLDLQSLGAIKIHNKGEERVPGTTIYEYQILINHLAFDGIYQKCIKEVTKKSLQEYESQIEVRENLPALKVKLNEFISVNKIIGKRAEFLQLLSDFEPKLIDALKDEIKVKDLKDLKKQVKHKIKGSGFSIKTIRSKSFSKSGAYQLIPSHQEL